ncbi:NADH dehydrogenase [ubiquinone] 1 alpha subcomplex assembly factor 3 [Mactra antiquata]
MSLRKLVRTAIILSRRPPCLRQCVRCKKSISPEVTERYLQPDHQATQSSMMNMISLQEGNSVYVTRFSPLGFVLQNGVKLSGPSVFFPRSYLKWKITRASDINEKSLGMFTMLTPKLDLLIIGTGSRQYSLPPETITFLRKKNINFEVFTSDHAIATFNFQNNDQRWIAAAIIPPERQSADLQDYVVGKYKDILDVSSLPMEDEIELRKLEKSGAEKAKRLQGDVENLKQDSSNIKQISSPLGAPRSFMSSDFVGVEMKEKNTTVSRDKVFSERRRSEVDNEDDKDK